MHRIYLKCSLLSIAQNGLFAHGGCSMRQVQVLCYRSGFVSVKPERFLSQYLNSAFFVKNKDTVFACNQKTNGIF